MLTARNWCSQWLPVGRERFLNAAEATFRISTRRGNQVWHIMRDQFIVAMDSLACTVSAVSRNAYFDLQDGIVTSNDSIAAMCRILSIRNNGAFKIYFVSKMLHRFDASIVHDVYVGPSVLLGPRNTALTLLFPTCVGSMYTSAELLHVCKAISFSLH